MENVGISGESAGLAQLETPVLIVGAGPAGQMAALMLSHHGIASTIVERRVERMSAPKAHAVNPRTLEICASLGVPVQSIYELATPAHQGGQVQFMSSLAGVSFGALPYERQDEAVREFTPYPLANIAQPRFEEILSQAIDGRADISVLRGCTCTAVEQDGEGVSAQVELKGASSALAVRSRYLLAADGAGSRLRGMLGIEMEGPEALEQYMMIHFNADLSEQVRSNPGILYFLLDPAVSATLIAYDQADNWVLMHSCEAARHDVSNFDEETCIGLINKAVGHPIEGVRIRNVSPWVMSSQVAAHYRQGRVFLVGDAAHRFPPTGGLGLNTGVGDVQNITWKIAAVEKGWAGAALFDSYQPERKTVAEVNSTQSLNNAIKMFELMSFLYGDDPEQRAEHFQHICNTALGSAGLEAAVEKQRPHFDSLRLQLGYSYVEEKQRGELGHEINISDYQPAYVRGSHLPHSWVEVRGSRKSLLDLLPCDQFSLLARAGQESWQDVLDQIDIPVLGLQEERDFVGASAPWGEQAGLENVGALLIRPDGHIAQTFATETPARERALGAALAEQLCNPGLQLAEAL